MGGGFLGVGGERVSDAEKATLADIAKAPGHNRSPESYRITARVLAKSPHWRVSDLFSALSI